MQFITKLGIVVLALLGIALAGHWGLWYKRMPETITVTGTAQQSVSNQVAQFYAGIQARSDDKQTAVNEANQQITQVITSLKEFGIAEEDIKTENMSVYQEQDSVTTDGRQRMVSGQWQASNSLQIKLRDVERASELMEVLAGSGLNNIYGPNFMLDEGAKVSEQLLNQAVENAKTKATTIAGAQGKKIKRVLSITEGYTQQPGIFMDRAMGAGGGGAPTFPGTTSQEAAVTVVFEMR